MNYKDLLSLSLRYLIIILLGLNSLFVFYLIFTPLTVYISFTFINAFYGATLFPGDVIFFKGYYARIIPACVAGAAYYLLLILNLTTPMPLKKRIASILFLCGAFLVINTLRILVFASLIFKGYQYFDIAHSATWYFGSTVMVIIIWFANVLIFRIRDIPVYTDLKTIIQQIKK